MKKHIFILSVLLVALSAGYAFALNITRTVYSFERAHRLEVGGLPDKAAPHWAKAAEGFAAFLDSDDRRAAWASYRVMAGISLCMAGRYELADKAFAPLSKINAQVPEAYSYGGLALAMLGKKEAAMDVWSRYPLGFGQRVVANEITSQLKALQAGGSLNEAGIKVRNALIRQAKRNVTMPRSQASLSGVEQCDGAFWWRYNRSRCERGSFMSFP